MAFRPFFNTVMHIVTGAYRFRKKRIGVKNEFCNACYAEAPAVLEHAYEFMHLYWVPLVPMGPRSRWYCTRCGKNPTVRVQTTRGTYVTGAIAFFVIAALMGEFAIISDARVEFAVAGGVLSLACIYMANKAVRYRKRNCDAHRAAVVPLGLEDNFPICRARLETDPYLHCAHCKILVY